MRLSLALLAAFHWGFVCFVPDGPYSSANLYAASLHWSVMTIASISYSVNLVTTSAVI